jgi:hypothetical protein
LPWRSDQNALAFETRAQFTCELNRAGRITMQTNGFRAHGYVAAIDGANFSFL